MNKDLLNYKKEMEIVDAIRQKQAQLSSLSDNELQNHFLTIKSQIKNNESSDDSLVNVYAIVCESAKRVLGLNLYDVQILGAIILNNGDISEMATGEGKTLVATMPAVLNSIKYNSVHIATTNDYLAKRDSEEMGKIFKFLGLSVGTIYQGQTIEDKKLAYKCDITYGTGSELGFDYLRDQTASSPELLTCQNLGYCIVDEVDSILIDDASIPLVLNAQESKTQSDYQKANDFVKTLNKNDYIFIRDSNKIYLSDLGISKAEKYFGIDFENNKNIDCMFYISNALIANYTLKKDVDYVIKKNSIKLIDHSTGRIVEGRQYSNQLHQAIETKENLPISPTTKTIATISYPRYFSLYKKISGMTGTAISEKDEFLSNYNMLVKKIPTNKEVQRKDLPTRIFDTKENQINSILNEINISINKGQPVLIGTNTETQSYELDKILNSLNIPHNILNANTKAEAELISLAGKKGQITITTNIAGRGTDIKLGGDAVQLTIKELTKSSIELSEQEKSQVFGQNFDSTNEKLINARNLFCEISKKCKDEKAYLNNIGGLKVIATRLYDNERIEKQLKGRSGRQGDNGETISIISLDDDILKRYCGEKLDSLKNKVKSLTDENGQIFSKAIFSLTKTAEIKCQALKKDARHSNYKFDNIIDRQRKIIYKTRMQLLKSKKLTNEIYNFSKDVILNCLNSSDNIDEINNRLKETFLKFAPILNEQTLESFDDKTELACSLASQMMEKRKSIYDIISKSVENKGVMQRILTDEKKSIIFSIDKIWSDYLDKIDLIKSDSFLQCYSQQDPYISFVLSTKQEYDKVVDDVKSMAVYNIYTRLGNIANEINNKLENEKEI